MRVRILDSRHLIQGLSDLSVPAEQFAKWALPVERAFITENEINGLAFPEAPGSAVIFGLGYSLERLHEVTWLRDKAIHYWGDIDTHGFAILDRLRAAFPNAKSLLMDRATLMGHRALWVEEGEPHAGDPVRLTDEERALYDDLRQDALGVRVRLEQERIGFGWVERAVREVVGR